jgi:hypothetical protein
LLPLKHAYQGLPWCKEIRTDHTVDWQWGTSADMIDIFIGGGGVMIGRSPNPAGCTP